MKKVLFGLLCLPYLCLAQGNDPETILRQKEEAEKIRKAKEVDENRFKFPRDSSGQIKYVEVVPVDNASAKDLYSRAKLFIADTYKSGKTVTQLNDDESKTIVVKPAASVTYNEPLGIVRRQGYIDYQLKIECKDNRYRYTIDGLTFKFVVTTGFEPWSLDSEKKAPVVSKKQWLKVQEDADTQMNLVIALLKQAMKKPTSDF
ncbi:MAG: DUF4468 domain-containing protein [Chitinophagaceae bacterium]|nr:DUF4468 domain-containing protein [Chitinophagaceae bacterium]